VQLYCTACINGVTFFRQRHYQVERYCTLSYIEILIVSLCSDEGSPVDRRTGNGEDGHDQGFHG